MGWIGNLRDSWEDLCSTSDERAAKAGRRALDALERRRELVAAERALAEEERQLAGVRQEREADAIRAEVALHKFKLEAGHALLDLKLQVVEKERELWLHETAFRLPLPEAKAFIEGERERENLLLQRAIARQRRLAGIPEPEPAPPPSLPAPPSPRELSPQHARAIAPPANEPKIRREAITDAEIEAIARRSITRIGDLEPLRQEAVWDEWRAELRRRFPPLIAEEVEDRVAVLRAKRSGRAGR